MLDFDQHLQFANALTSSMAKAASGMLSASTAVFDPPEPKEPGRSWYRAPAANPFDWTTWGLPTATTMQPWTGGWAAGFGQPAGLQAYAAVPFAQQPWSALASFANTMVALQSSQNMWSSLVPATGQTDIAAKTWQAMMWPLAQASVQLSAFAAAATEPDTYSSYRSDGGHAVAQLSAVEPKPTEAPIVNMFTWAAPTVH